MNPPGEITGALLDTMLSVTWPGFELVGTRIVWRLWPTSIYNAPPSRTPQQAFMPVDMLSTNKLPATPPYCLIWTASFHSRLNKQSDRQAMFSPLDTIARLDSFKLFYWFNNLLIQRHKQPIRKEEDLNQVLVRASRFVLEIEVRFLVPKSQRPLFA